MSPKNPNMIYIWVLGLDMYLMKEHNVGIIPYIKEGVVQLYQPYIISIIIIGIEIKKLFQVKTNSLQGIVPKCQHRFLLFINHNRPVSRQEIEKSTLLGESVLCHEFSHTRRIV